MTFDIASMGRCWGRRPHALHAVMAPRSSRHAATACSLSLQTHLVRRRHSLAVRRQACVCKLPTKPGSGHTPALSTLLRSFRNIVLAMRGKSGGCIIWHIQPPLMRRICLHAAVEQQCQGGAIRASTIHPFSFHKNFMFSMTCPYLTLRTGLLGRQSPPQQTDSLLLVTCESPSILPHCETPSTTHYPLLECPTDGASANQAPRLPTTQCT